MKTTIKALKYDKDLPEIGAFKVHSIFSNSLNLEDSQGGLIHLGKEINLIPPKGIIISAIDFNKIKDSFRLGDNFKKVDGEIFLKDYKIRLDIKNSYDSRLKVYYNKKVSIKRIVELKNNIMARKYTNGFKVRLDRSFTSREYKIISKIINYSTREDLLDNLRLIIGRGVGLTPSGDDILLGILWVNSIFKILNQEVLEEIHYLLNRESLTTDISKSYYLYAIENRYTSSLLDLYEYLLDEERDMDRIINKIASYGSTSGIDLLTGIIYGLEEALK